MVSQIYPLELQLNKANTSDTEAPFLDLHLSISNDIFSSKNMINVTTLILKMWWCSSLYILWSLYISTHLLELLAMLLTSTLAINWYLRNSLNKAISIINFAKHFLNFIDDTMIWFLNSKLDLNLSCAKDFRNLISMVTWCIIEEDCWL